TVVQDDSVVLTGLTPKTQYFIHIRSKCDSLGFPVYSPWTAGKPVALASSGTGIEMNSLDAKEISVYPNPVNDMLHIDVLSATVPTGMLELCTIDGRILRRQDKLERSNIIDTKALTPGLYFLRYYNGQTMQVIKLIRQ
ncbi:MAG: T9SS type A sorting domain-containing protein, partial [Flavipsychrobacter sp.]